MTELLAEYSLGLSWQSQDKNAIEEAKRFFTDCLGCLLAGTNEVPTAKAIAYAKYVGGKNVVSVLGKKDMRVDPYNGAIINGIAAHVHDYDDCLSSMNGHPSAAVLPAVFACAELINASGKDVLMAYIAGVEVCALMGIGFNKKDRYYSQGWHSTSSLGIFGATVAAGRLLGLTKQELIYALSIAASESFGLKGNFGTMTKSLHAGRAAAKGFYAAQMAKLGYRSNPDIMEIKEGFAFINIGTIDRSYIEESIKEHRTAFLNPGLTMKPWPCCKQNHSSINSIQTLKARYAFSADDVEKVHCLVQPVIYDCLKYNAPTTKLQGKFSINYNVALAVLYGNVTLKDFEGVDITDPRVIDFMQKVYMTVDDEVSGGQYNNGLFDNIVMVYLKDGRVLKERTVRAKGDFVNKMTETEIEEKFIDCASRALSNDGIAKVKQYIDVIGEKKSVQELTALINDAALQI